MSLKTRARSEEKADSQGRSPLPAGANQRVPNGRHTHPATIYQLARARPDVLTPRAVLQLQRAVGNRAVAQLLARTAQPRPTRAGDRTGLPDGLKAAVENLSGVSLDDVKVHYDSPKPAELRALAYTQGTDIHLGAGQAKHLAHEAWHVVQQKQQRVSPMRRLDGVAINDDDKLEREAETMGARALGARASAAASSPAEEMQGGRSDHPTASGRASTEPVRPVLQGFFHLDQADSVEGEEPLFQSQSPDPRIKRIKKKSSLDYDQQETPWKTTRLLVADDLSMAVQDTVREPKEFFALKAVVADSNKRLAATHSPLRLGASGGAINIGPAKLERIQPLVADDKKSPTGFPALWHDICINLTNTIMGNLGQQSEEVLLRQPKSSNAEGLLVNVGGLGAQPVDRLARHLARGKQMIKPRGKRRRKHGNRVAAALGAMRQESEPGLVGEAYGRALASGRVDEEARAISANQYAEPEVGEGFATFSIAASKTEQLDYSESEPDADPEVKKDTWGYHHAAVVARSPDGRDRVTLENYRRNLQAGDLVEKHLLKKYAVDASRKAQELKKRATKAEKSDPNWPEFLKIDVYQYLMTRHPQASEEYMSLMNGTDFRRLWFFRMYGSHKGQSFHERQAASGGYVNPLTLRVRRHMPTVIGYYRDSLQDTSGQLKKLLTSASLTYGPTRSALVKLEASAQAQIKAIDARLKELSAAATKNADVHAAIKEANEAYHKWVRKTLAPRLGDIIQDITRGSAPRVKTESFESLRTLASTNEVPSFMDLLGDFFLLMHQGLPEDEVQRRATLAELRRLVPQLPTDALTPTQVEKDNSSPDTSARPRQPAKLSKGSAKTLGKYSHELEGTRVAEFLAYRGLVIQETVRDGDCMYDAIRSQLESVDGLRTTIGDIRRAVARLLRDNQNYFADYVANRNVNAVANQISQVQSWNNEGGDIAAQAIATVLQRDVIVISPSGIDRRSPLGQLVVNHAARIGAGGNPLTIVYNGADHYYSTRQA